MAAHEPSIAELIRNAVHDGQELVRSEIALAKAEARDAVRRAGTAAAMLAGAAIAAIIGVVLLMTTLAWAISETLVWPVWAGFGIVTLLVLVTAAALAYIGRSRLVATKAMPRTVDTLKENMEWMRARTS